MVPSRENFCLAYLRELIDEDASINHLRRILSSSASSLVEEALRKKLEEIEAFLRSKTPRNSDQVRLTVGQVAAVRTIAKIRKMGVPIERLRPLYAWLENSINFAFTLVVFGFQAFLITDLDKHHAIWSDCDVADDLFLGAEQIDRACLVICLNKTINDLWVENGLERSPLRWHFFHAYKEQIGEITPAWEMESTNAENDIEAK